MHYTWFDVHRHSGKLSNTRGMICDWLHLWKLLSLRVDLYIASFVETWDWLPIVKTKYSRTDWFMLISIFWKLYSLVQIWRLSHGHLWKLLNECDWFLPDVNDGWMLLTSFRNHLWIIIEYLSLDGAWLVSILWRTVEPLRIGLRMVHGHLGESYNTWLSPDFVIDPVNLRIALRYLRNN